MRTKRFDHFKANRNKLETFRELKGLSAFIELYSRTENKGETISVYKIIVEDTSSHHRFLGYSLDKSQTGIEIFTSYVLSNLRPGSSDPAGVKISGSSKLDQTRVIKEPVHFRSMKNSPITSGIDHREILKKLYKELLLSGGYAKNEGAFLSDSPVIPPVFVDSFIKDIEKIRDFTDFWKDYSLSKEDNDILLSTLYETAKDVERYEDELDFEKAVMLYNRLQNAASGLHGSEKFSAGVIMKKAKIFFHLEQYEKCRDIVLDGIGMMTDAQYNDELGELYYYLGMIAAYSNNPQEADRYFTRTLWLLNKTENEGKRYIHYDAQIRKRIVKNDLKNALVKVNECIRVAFGKDNEKKLGHFYGVKAEIYIRDRKYSKALECLDMQLEYAKKNKDMIGESKCISQIFSTSSYSGSIDQSAADEYLKRIKQLSKKTGKASYYYNSLISFAIYLYRRGEKDKAEKYFRRSAVIFSEKSESIEEHIVNMIYLAKIMTEKKKYIGAVRLLNRLNDICASNSIRLYPAYIENTLALVYNETSRYRVSNSHINRCFQIIDSENIPDTVLKAHSHKLAGINFAKISNVTKAVKHFNEALRYLKAVGSPEAENDIVEIKDIMKGLAN